MTKVLAHDRNQTTQPLPTHKVFNNWDVVAEGWYIVCKSKDLKKNAVKSFDLYGQHICVFRDSKSQVHGMDGYCPHMGVDLGIGKVVNDRVQCFFHNWEFDGNGECKHIPAGEPIPKRACLTSYKIEEKYGLIWINPNKDAKNPVLEVPGLEGQEVSHVLGKSLLRTCHHHINMINGLDPQHLSTVHNINMQMDIDIRQESTNIIEIELRGEMPETRFAERMAKRLLGDSYSYSMKYADGCVGMLTIMKGVALFGKYKVLPELHMLYAYQLVEPGTSSVWPIFLTKKRPGIIGGMTSRLLMFMTKMAYYTLRGEDGDVYENIRFSAQNLLTMDAPVGKYIQYINRLKPSIWSKSDTKAGKKSTLSVDPEKKETEDNQSEEKIIQRFKAV